MTNPDSTPAKAPNGFSKNEPASSQRPSANKAPGSSSDSSSAPAYASSQDKRARSFGTTAPKLPSESIKRNNSNPAQSKADGSSPIKNKLAKQAPSKKIPNKSSANAPSKVASAPTKEAAFSKLPFGKSRTSEKAPTLGRQLGKDKDKKSTIDSSKNPTEKKTNATKNKIEDKTQKIASKAIQAKTAGLVPKSVADKAAKLVVNKKVMIAAAIATPLSGIVVLVAVIAVIAAAITGGTASAIAGPQVGGAEYTQIADYIPGEWDKILAHAATTAQTYTPPVYWTIVAGTAKVMTDYGRRSPYDAIDRDPGRKGKDTDSLSPVVAGAQAATSTVSKTGTIDKYKGNFNNMDSFESACPVKNPSPAIGGGPGQGVGVFLLTPNFAKQMVSDGKDPNNPCAAADALVNSVGLVENSVQNDSAADHWDPSTPETARGFWQTSLTRAGILVNPSAPVNCVPVIDTKKKDLEVDSVIRSIWGCEIDKSSGITMVASTSVNTDNTINFADTLTGSDARQQAISEALAVSYNFSKWKYSTGACSNSSSVAGIFPLSAATAAKFGDSNRCSLAQNIDAAAKAFLSIETTPINSRSIEQGSYAPMLGGWLTMPAVFGTELNDLLKKGPADSWRPSSQCSSLITTYLKSIAPKTSLFAKYAGGQKITDAALTAELAAAAKTTKAVDPLPSLVCKAPPLTSYYTTLAETVQSLAGISSTPTNSSSSPSAASSSTSSSPVLPSNPTTLPTSVATVSASSSTSAVPSSTSSSPVPAVDYTAAYNGLSLYYSAKAQKAVGKDAVYGKSSLISRASRSDSPVVFPNNTSANIIETPTPSFTSRIVDYAVFYGGIVTPFNTQGQLTGSLKAGADGSDTGSTFSAVSGSGLNMVVVAAAEKWLGTMYAWAGGNAQGPTLGVCGPDGAVNDCHVKGFDCSGLTLYAYAQVGVTLGHFTGTQITQGKLVPGGMANAIPGDLVFYGGLSPHHVAMYVGNGKMIEAPQSGEVIHITTVRTSDGFTGPYRYLTAAQIKGSGSSSATGNNYGPSPDWAKNLPAPGKSLAPLFQTAGKQYHIDPRFLAAISWQESNFNTSTGYCSGVGACGLMQLMPGTATGLGLSLSPVDERYNPQKAIPAAAKMLSGLYAEHANFTLTAAAYNAGDGAVAQYNGVPPYAETQNYVVKVIGYYNILCSK